MKNNFIKRNYKNAQDFDETFFSDDDPIQGEIVDNTNKSEFLGKYLSNKKINVFFILICICLSILLSKNIYLQIYKSDFYSQVAEINRTNEKALISARGLIYDKNKEPLVNNIPIFDVYLLPKDLSLKNERRVNQIKEIVSVIEGDESSINDLVNKYPKNFKYLITIKEDIEYEQAILLKMKAQQLPGLYVESRNQREYIYPEAFSHLLGYQGKITEEEFDKKESEGYLLNDYIGKTGLELFYEAELRGEYGKERLEVDVYGKEKKVLYLEEAINGKNLVLTIDSEVQQKVREIAKDYLEKFGKAKASIVMSNPQNGEILALVSLPDFNNNLFAKGISREDYNKYIDNENNPLFNRSIKGEYPSGSTIKPVVAAAALQEKIVTDKTSFMSKGGLWLYERWFFPDWSAGGHGITNVYRAIAWSVNTYFYIIGGGYEDFNGLGVEGLNKYYKMFGLGEKTGLDLLGEKNGLVPDPVWKMKVKEEQWYIGDTYHMAIGQGDLLVTPLQVNNFTSTFANNGNLYKLHLVKEIISNDKQSVILSPQLLNSNFIDKNNINIVKNAMRQTVTLGSAKLLNNLNVEVAGKTGTAQWNNSKDHHAWFTCFAPFNAPEVALTVLVEEGGEGSQISVPISYDILNWYFNVYKDKNQNDTNVQN